MVIFIVLLNILVFNGEVAEPGLYSGAEYGMAIVAIIAVGLMHHYARDNENYTYTTNLWIADFAAFLFCIMLLWLDIDLLMHPAKHELFLQKSATAPFRVHHIFICMIVGMTILNLVGLVAKLKKRVQINSKHHA